jgi:hypothetical protein
MITVLENYLMLWQIDLKDGQAVSDKGDDSDEKANL